METAKILFDVETSDADCLIGIKIILDDVTLLDIAHVKEKITFSHAMSDDDGEHELKIELSGKTIDHTKIDEHGNIIKDAVLQVLNVTIDAIDVHKLFLEKCVYTHDFNGTQPEIADTFYGTAGCNGVISFKFSTPIYLWLLENM